MTRPTQTYSMQKQLITNTKRLADVKRNNIFHQIFTEENIFDNSASDGQNGLGKIAAQKGRKRNKNLKKIKAASATINRSNSREAERNDRSPMLFCDDNQIKKKTKRAQKRKDHLMKVRQKTSSKVRKKIPDVHEDHCSDASSMSPVVSENPENTEGFVIEEAIAQRDEPLAKDLIRPEKNNKNQSVQFQCSGKGTRQTSSKLQDSLSSESVHQTDADSSVEIPRDATQSSALYYGSLTQSPLVCLVMSDEDSPTNFGRMSRKAETDCLTDASSRPTDFLSSYERVETSAHISRTESSDYTYSYVSTYTEATCTGSVRTIATSPPVKMKMCPTLNSTPCKGKDCIGVIEFPDALSPIAQQKENNLLPKARQKAAGRHDQLESLRMKGTPKCSTVLFGSDISCCSPLNSVNLTTINSQEGLQIGESRLKGAHPGHKMDGISSSIRSVHQVTPTNGDNISVGQSVSKDFHIERRQWKSMKTSTPQDDEQKMTLSISPVELQIDESDEDELQVNNSSVVNTDEIIVPSLTEITGHSRNSFQVFKVNDGNNNDTTHFHANRQNKDIITSASSRTETYHPNSSSKNVIGNGNPVDTKMKTTLANSTFSRAARTTPSASDIVPSVKTNDKHKAGLEVTARDSDSKQTRARKLHRYDNRELDTSPSANDNDIHKEKDCYSNNFQGKFAKKIRQSARVLRNSDSYQELPPLLQENTSTPQEAKKALSDESSDSIIIKKFTTSKTGMKERLVLNICCINKLCMANRKDSQSNANNVYQQKH